MSTGIKARRRALSQLTTHGKAIVALIVTFTLAFVVFCVSSVQSYDNAYATIYPVSEPAASDQADDSSSSPDKASAAGAQDEAAESEGEAIEDDANPMSSGLGGGEPVSSSSGIGIEWIIVLGIIAVVVFFALSTHRLNDNISKMRKSIGRK